MTQHYLRLVRRSCSTTHPSATTKPKESIMTKAQLKEIRQILNYEYRIAVACKRSFSPIWYLFV